MGYIAGIKSEFFPAVRQQDGGAVGHGAGTKFTGDIDFFDSAGGRRRADPAGGGRGGDEPKHEENQDMWCNSGGVRPCDG